MRTGALQSLGPLLSEDFECHVGLISIIHLNEARHKNSSMEERGFPIEVSDMSAIKQMK